MSYVKYEANGPVGIITLDRPKALNALSIEMLNDIESALNSVDLEVVRAVIITGSGTKAFAAGADIAEMHPLNRDGGEAYGKFGSGIFRRIEEFPIPTIAAVNGYALGGGNELCMSCDIRICSENAIFGQPEVSLGITPGFGGTQRLARLVPVGKAKELLYTGKNINAGEAYRIGLVNAVYPMEELMPAAIKLAEAIAKNAPIAVRYAKKEVNEGLQKDIDEALKVEYTYFGCCFSSEDQKEGMGAFLEKRKEKHFKNK